MTCKIGILISGRGTNMEAIVDHIAAEKADVQVLFVASDNASAAGLRLARQRGIPTAVLPYKEGRAAGEAAVEKLWQERGIDLLVLAGFMRLLTGEFVGRHEGRILNIHPALLPKFPGAHGIEDFWESGEAVSGVTVHLVDDKMDHGPILTQRQVARDDEDTIETFEAKIHAVEHQIYWQALKDYIKRISLGGLYMRRRALISVADKSGALELGQTLVELGWEILSSSGTAKMFRDAGVPVVEVSDATKFPHILGGRVKTLHPLVFGGILARRDLEADVKDMQDHGIDGIDMVAVNLYPFEKTARSGAALDALIENIDIGGVALIRAAAKNYRYVTVMTDPADYASVLEELKAEGDVTPATRRRLALRAFDATARYDATIGDGLRRELGEKNGEDSVTLPLVRKQELRYGENPHQRAGVYLPPLADSPVTQLAGKELSYNNLLDLDAAMRATAMLQSDVGAVVIKHTTPCGMAVGKSVAEAYDRAFACDSLSAFGGVVGVTRHIDLETAEAISKHFTEVLLCPSIEDAALKLLTEKRKNLRVMTWKGGRVFDKQMVSTWCGLLMQDDELAPLPDQSKGQWVGVPRPDLWDDLVLAWKVAAVSKSNAVAMVKDGEAVGIGMGFCSRVFAVDFAARQAGEKAKGAVMASDAFFPFPDGVEKAAAAGIVAIIQPGGSLRDEEVAARAQELGVSMFISGHRTFRH